MTTAFPSTRTGSFALPATPPPWPDVPGFEVLSVLGQGAMGIVYKAVQRSLGRVVAIKAVLPGAGAEGLARFQAEAEAIARLSHPHLVSVHQVGDLAPPGHPASPFLVMEYVGGGTLDAFLENRPQPPRVAAELAATLADAVQHAHDHGIVHRDLKPSNILLKAGESPPWPKISDFGLAKSSERPAGLTLSGSIMGTPGYMAPEQARGESPNVGPPADIHALGAILYQMLTGRPPFLGATALDTIQQVVRDEPVPPRRLVPHLPRDLETITLKCLRKEPHKRYASAAALAADLRRYLAGEPVLARPPRLPERAVKWVRRNPMLSALVLVSFLSVIGMQAGTYLHQRQLGEALAAARASAAESRHALARLGVEQGCRALDGGNAALALSWFAGTLAMDEDPARQRLHRIRYAAALREMPALAGLWLHGGPIRAASFSADGARLLTAGDDGIARVREGASGAVIGQPLRHPSGITRAIFGPDGAVILGGAGGQVRIHSAGGITDITPAHSGPVTALEVLPGGLLLSASEDGTARLWSLATGKPVLPAWKHPAAVLAASASPDGSLVATGGADGRARLFAVKDGEPAGELAHPVQVTALAWRPGGGRLATACADGGVRMWDSGGKLLFTRKHRAAAAHLAFSRDGASLASSSDDQTARVWDAATGFQLATLQHACGVNQAAFSPDGALVLTVSDDSSARVWSADGGMPATPWLPHAGGVIAGAFSPDGRRVLTASIDHSARLWHLRSGQAVPPPTPPHWPAREPPRRWDGPGGLALERVGDHAARLLADGRAAGTLRHGSLVLAAAFLADGSRVATGSDDNMARVWDTSSGSLVGRELPHRASVRMLAFNADGTLLATAAADLGVRVWDVSAGLPLTPTWAAGGPPVSLSFEGDSLRVAYPGGKSGLFPLAPEGGDVEHLRRRAALLSGRTADPLRGITSLPPESLPEG